MLRITTTALIFLLTLLIAPGCARDEADQSGDGTTAAEQARTHLMYGVLVGHDPARNTVTIDNENVPGVMAPMKMDYELRAADARSLPPNGTRVQVTLHDENGRYWVTDVKPAR